MSVANVQAATVTALQKPDCDRRYSPSVAVASPLESVGPCVEHRKNVWGRKDDALDLAEMAELAKSGEEARRAGSHVSDNKLCHLRVGDELDRPAPSMTRKAAQCV